MGSGNAAGNLIALIIAIVAGLLGFISFTVSATALLVAVYVIGGYWLYMDHFGYTEYKPEIQRLLTTDEKTIAKKYHLYLSAFMGPAQGVSALLNALRLLGVVWGIVGLIKGIFLVPVLFALYFFAVSGIISKLDPDLYIGGYAHKTGDPKSVLEIQTLKSVENKFRQLLS